MTMVSPILMTTDELLALPDDGIERDLIEGHIRERGMTRRSRPHSRTEARIAYLLSTWVATQPEPRGEVVSGEAGIRLRRNPDTTVGVDVAYVSPEVAGNSPSNAFLIEGVPLLVVEILSPSDKQEDILEKVRVYLDSGVQMIWVVEPIFQTVTIYRPDEAPGLVNIKGVLIGDPLLPGLRIPVASLFSR